MIVYYFHILTFILLLFCDLSNLNQDSLIIFINMKLFWQILSFQGTNKVDQVFKSALNEFCNNLTAMYSYTNMTGSTNGLRYKDIVNNFRQVIIWIWLLVCNKVNCFNILSQFIFLIHFNTSWSWTISCFFTDFSWSEPTMPSSN